MYGYTFAMQLIVKNWMDGDASSKMMFCDHIFNSVSWPYNVPKYLFGPKINDTAGI